MATPETPAKPASPAPVTKDEDGFLYAPGTAENTAKAVAEMMKPSGTNLSEQDVAMFNEGPFSDTQKGDPRGRK